MAAIPFLMPQSLTEDPVSEGNRGYLIQGEGAPAMPMMPRGNPHIPLGLLVLGGTLYAVLAANGVVKLSPTRIFPSLANAAWVGVTAGTGIILLKVSVTWLMRRGVDLGPIPFLLDII